MELVAVPNHARLGRHWCGNAVTSSGGSRGLGGSGGGAGSAGDGWGRGGCGGAGDGWGRGGCGGCGGSGDSGGGGRGCWIHSDGANHAVLLAGIEIGAVDAGIQAYQVLDTEGPSGGKALAGSAAVGSGGVVALDTATNQGSGRDHCWGEPNGSKVFELHSDRVV